MSKSIESELCIPYPGDGIVSVKQMRFFFVYSEMGSVKNDDDDKKYTTQRF